MTIRSLWPQLLCLALAAASPLAGRAAQPGGVAPGAAATEASPSDQPGSKAGFLGAAQAPMMQQTQLSYRSPKL